jgi:hypothetical protein
LSASGSWRVARGFRASAACAPFTFSGGITGTPSTSATQRLRLEIGRHSWMRTVSPVLNRLVSSCAAYFFERITYFL